jgi:Ca-activated chloride channel family protein
MASQDFRNDAKDAGEIGAGHAVTAFYEVVPPGALESGEKPLKYGTRESVAGADSPELLTVSLRWKTPEATATTPATEIEVPLVDAGLSYDKASADFKFAAAVAAFALVLRDSPHRGTATLDAVSELASEGLSFDPSGWRAEFVSLVTKAKSLLPSGR